MELAYERSFGEWARSGGVRWERMWYPRPEAGGETVAHRFTPPVAPRGVVLAVHGAGNDALFAWVGLFKRLLRAGVEVFTFDLDGHGRTGTTRFSAEGVAGALPEAVRRSGALERGLPLHALGVSLGGSVLLASLPSLPGVASAVLMAAPLRIRLSWAAVRREAGLRLARCVWREREHYGAWGLIPSFGPVKRGAYPLRLAETPPPGAFGYVEVLNRALERMRLEEAARRVRVPTLLVYGGADLLVPVEQGERLARLIPAAELLRLEGETHLSAPMAPQAVHRVVEWVTR